MSSALFVKELNYLAFLTASLRFLPALKTGTLRAGIFKGFLVLGLIPLRALRCATLKEPKPTKETFSPFSRIPLCPQEQL